MIEKIILDYLNAKMTEQAYMEEPESPPAEYMRIELQGASVTDHVADTSTHSIEHFSQFLNQYTSHFCICIQFL